MSKVSKDLLIYQAKLAEQAERYEDMVEIMKQVADQGEPLSTEHRNMLSVAYKNVIGVRRSSWRGISAIESKSLESGENVMFIKEYRERIERELNEICTEVKNFLDEKLIPQVGESTSKEDRESSVFYYKMKGDYCRYQAEYMRDSERDTAADDGEKAYKEAEKKAEQLEATHPIRLGLSLNFSVFYYEIKGDSNTACDTAKKAFDEAITGLEKLEEDHYKDSTLIMQLLRDNLTLWTADTQDKYDEDQDKQD